MTVAGRRIVAWCLYDWAYSAFNTVVTTFVFATYFVRAVAGNPSSGTALWAGTQAVAGIVIALCAVPLGAVADRGGHGRSLLTVFTLVVVVSTAGLWFVRPERADVAMALILVATATIAYELATTFYNAMLPELATPGRLGRISGIAWGAGYVGGLVCLVLCLLVLILPHPARFGLNAASAEPIRAATVFAAAWMLVFSIPLMAMAPSGANRLGLWRAMRDGLRSVAGTLRTAGRDRTMRNFLIARMLYSDGLTTLFAFGAIYAAGRFGMDARQVLLLGIGLTASAGVGTLAFAMVEDRIGSKTTVLVSLVCLVVLGAGVLLAPDRRSFWMAALPLGLFLGPAQSASRSLMAVLATPGDRRALFGLYALSGRVTGFIGPAALGIVTAWARSQQAGMAVILVLLVAGGLLLAGVHAPARTIRVRTAT